MQWSSRDVSRWQDTNDSARMICLHPHKHAHQHPPTQSCKLYCTFPLNDQIDYKLCFCFTSSHQRSKSEDLLKTKAELLSEAPYSVCVCEYAHTWHCYNILAKVKHILCLNLLSLSNVKPQEMPSYLRMGEQLHLISDLYIHISFYTWGLYFCIIYLYNHFMYNHFSAS